MLATLRSARPYAWALLLIQCAFIIIYFVGTEYSEKPADPRITTNSTTTGGKISDSSVNAYYWYFNHIVIMMPIGFGYLVTFLRKYRYSGVGFTFVLTALIFQWSLIVVTFWERVRRPSHGATSLVPSHSPILRLSRIFLILALPPSNPPCYYPLLSLLGSSWSLESFPMELESFHSRHVQCCFSSHHSWCSYRKGLLGATLDAHDASNGRLCSQLVCLPIGAQGHRYRRISHHSRFWMLLRTCCYPHHVSQTHEVPPRGSRIWLCF